jgi:Predicted metal-dependent phosphoesterases (PHP family)
VGKHKSNKHHNTSDKAPVKYNIYYGIPHAHTGYSTGKGSPLDAYNYAKKNKLDFLIVTDHVSALKDSTDYRDKKVQKWVALQNGAKHMNEKHKSFLALGGFECKLNNFGDLNVFNSTSITKNSFKRIDNLTSWLENEPNAILSINHPHGSVEKLKRFSFLNSNISLIEVANGSRPFKYNRYYNYYYKLLDCGWKLGAIIGQDNHDDNWGDDENLTAVLAEDLSQDSILDALKNRRTYATESKSLKMTFKINSSILGDTLICDKTTKLNFAVTVEDKKVPIDKIEIITSNAKIVKQLSLTSKNRLTYFFSIMPSEVQKWYVVKVIQENNRYALSSPIFINMKEDIFDNENNDE